MPTPEHEAYRNSLLAWFKKHGNEPGVAEALKRQAATALVLWHLDLGPARDVLQQGYRATPRGSRPRDPIVMLRLYLLALLCSQPSINKWVEDLEGSRVLRVLGGLGNDSRPGVGTFYDFFHRLHDGPVRQDCKCVVRPSQQERRRAASVQPKRSKGKRKKKKRGRAGARSQGESKRARKRAKKKNKETAVDAAIADDRVTAKLVQELKTASDCACPNDLAGRLGGILLKTGVLESAKRGLLGDVQGLLVSGDGSPLRTGGSRYGKKTCDHPRRQRCDCPRIYTDPDAAIGWDNHREQFFYGHHFYELSVSSAGHDLPLALRLDPGNASDFTASLRTFDRLNKALKDHALPWSVYAFIADAGHDAEPIYRYLTNHRVKPVIPLSQDAPAIHPTRSDVQLSKKGFPLCKGGAEMVSWGSGGPDSRMFLCPVRAKQLDQCPRAPQNEPTWRCRPRQMLSPLISLRISHNPRLCPPIPRNAKRFQKLMNLRSGCERSNAVKKGTFRLEQARHRRASFWLIRLHGIALLQHAKAWTANEDAGSLVDYLLGRRHQAEAA